MIRNRLDVIEHHRSSSKRPFNKMTLHKSLTFHRRPPFVIFYCHTYTTNIETIGLWNNRSITHRSCIQYIYYHAKSIIHGNTSGKHRLLSSSAFHPWRLHHDDDDDQWGDTSRVFLLTLIINSFQQKRVTFHIDENDWCNKYLPWVLTRFFLRKRREKFDQFINCPIIIWTVAASVTMYLHYRIDTLCVFDVCRWSTSINWLKRRREKRFAIDRILWTRV